MERLNQEQINVLSKVLIFLDIQIDRTNNRKDWKEWNDIFSNILKAFPADEPELWKIFYNDKNERIFQGKYFKEDIERLEREASVNNNWF